MGKRLPFLSPSKPDMGAEFADMQYVLQQPCKDDPERKKIFRDAIWSLIYSNFQWDGLEPYEIDMIESSLLLTGRVAAVRTPQGVVFGKFGMTANGQGNDLVDFYGNPVAVTVTGYNGQIFEGVGWDNYAVGFDNCARERVTMFTSPIVTYIDHLVQELYDAWAAWKVAVETHKAGMVYVTSDKRHAALLRKVLSAVSRNDPYVVIESDITNNVQPLFAPNYNTIIGEYHANFMNVWSSVMDILGLENSPQTKKERLVVSEAEMNRSLSRYLAASRLKARKMFADQLNDKFGLSVKVENYLAQISEETPNDANVFGDNDGGEQDADPESRV